MTFSLKKVFSILSHRLLHFDWEWIFALDLSKDLKRIEATIPLEFRWGTETDIRLMDKALGFDAKGKKYTIERLRKGDKLFLAIYKGNIIGYIMIMKGAMELVPMRLLFLPSSKVYLYKGFVSKSYRGKKIIGQLLCDTIPYLRQNFRTLIMTVSEQNDSMLRVVGKLGFTSVGKIRVLRILGMEMPFVSKEVIRWLQSDR